MLGLAVAPAAVQPSDPPTPSPAGVVQDASPVSLAKILAYADQHAPEIRVARARLGRADAAFARARPRVPENPQASVGVGPRFLGGEVGVDAQVSLSQRVEIAGERRLRRTLAQRRRDRLQAELDAARWETHWEVHAAFHAALVARERAEVAQRLLTFQQRLLDIARRRLRAGDISPLPVRLAEGETAQAKVEQINARQGYISARLQLARLSGWPSAEPPVPGGTLDPPRNAPPLEHIVELALRHQPRLNVARTNIVEAQAQRRLARREAWPEPAFGVQFQRESIERGDGEYIVFGTFGLPLPLFRRNQADRAAARAELRIAQTELEALMLQLDAELAQAASAVDSAAERVAAYGEEILPRFEENLRLLERAYELGEIDILQVSVARERFLRIQNEALDAYNEYFQAVSELESSVGTDLWPEERHEPAAGGERGRR